MNQPPKPKPTPAQIKQIAENYKAMQQKIEHAGALLLEMARHPDMTDALLLEVVGSYRRAYRGLRSVHESCRKNIGESGSMFRPHPWETQL